jgi:pimeloyl-ACP methyl ester carboxylesterase
VSIQLNHHREGEGPPLLLHGVGHHWQAWRPAIELLRGSPGSAGFDVIACDSPGFGRSAPLPSAMEPTVTSYADAFEWFIAELGLTRPHVAGNSMGGAIGLELARRRAVGSVTAISPAGFWTAAERRFCQLSLSALAFTPKPARPALERAARTRAGRIALFSQTFGYPARLPAEEAVATLRDAWASPAMAAALRGFDAYAFQRPEDLRSVPVTVAWGERDRLLPYRLQAPRARAMMPWAKHVTLGAGHVPFYDDPPAVAAAVRATALRADTVPAPVRD